MKKKPTAGQRLRAFRLHNQLKVAELAAELGIHKNHVCALQSGRRKPGRDVALRIQDATGIGADEW